MCPFILPNPVDNVSESTNFLVLTTAFFYDNFVRDVISYAQNLTQLGQTVLLFDGSLGLGDLNFASSCYNPDVDAVLMRRKSISVLTKQDGHMDCISGVSKKMNLGAYSDMQFYNLLADLKLLGKNYQNILIYAPPTLPRVQKFFCQRLDSLCFAKVTQDSVVGTKKLMFLYPQMKCYLNVKGTHLNMGQSLQLAEMAEKDQILYNFTE